MSPKSEDTAAHEWWRTAVIYQIYPRSFADADGDGIGDLQGIASRLEHVAQLGADAIWLSPFFVSPQHDAGYDVADYIDVDPLFGTLDDFDTMIGRAHELGLRVIIDIVPNHTSHDHKWFKAAIAAGAGSKERDQYIFREGKGADGDEPPNNWRSVFGGQAWTRVTDPDGNPGQWYLHLFDESQPDLNWESEDVREHFDDVLRFWLDRGVDGFRVDVAHGLIKAHGLPDYPDKDDAVPEKEQATHWAQEDTSPHWAQDDVHDVWRRWRGILDSYDNDRILAAEAWVDPLSLMAKWVRPDEMHQAFNFSYLRAPWSAAALRDIIDESLQEFHHVGAPSTWVLSNHDVVRHSTRLSLPPDFPDDTGIGPDTQGLPDPRDGERRARAATLMMLALPGSAYLYQGEELGLPEVADIPDDLRQDPTWFRSDGERYGRDGCRVPIPWESDAPAYGFNATGESWLPQPSVWAEFARDRQMGDPTSTLTMYRHALALRAARHLGSGELSWIDGGQADVLAFTVNSITSVTNLGTAAVPMPPGSIVLASSPTGAELEPSTTVWLVA